MSASTDDLVHRYLDGLAGGDELARLDHALRTQPAAARALAAAARLDAELRLLHRAGRATAPDTRRVRRRIQRPPRRAWWPMLAAAAAGLAAAIGLWLLLSGPAVAPPSAPVVAAPFTRDGRGLAAGDALAGTVDVAGGGSVELAPGTTAIAAGDARHPVLELRAGTADCRIASRQEGATFAVRTPQGSAAVVGTRFRVVVADAITRVAVAEGTVAVAGTDAAVTPLHAGGEAVLTAGRPVLVFAPVAAVLTTAPAAWNNNSPGAVITAAGSDPTGRSATRLVARRANGWAGMLWADAPVDWRRYQGLSVLVRGTGSGRRFDLEILDNRGKAIPGVGDGCERYLTRLVDQSAEWRELRLPFAAMVRRPDLWPGQPNDGFGLDLVHGLSLIGDADGLDLVLGRIAPYAE